MSPTSETISRPNLMDMAPANQLLPRVQNFCPRTSLGWDCVLLCCAVLCCAVLCCISMYCVVTPIHFLSAQIHLLSLRFSSHLFSSPLLSPAQPNQSQPRNGSFILQAHISFLSPRLSHSLARLSAHVSIHLTSVPGSTFF
jgi:hypothetical protein